MGAPTVGLELLGRALAHDAAVVDDRDAPGQLVGLLEVLGGEEDGGALGVEPAHLLPEGDAADRIEPGGRLVEEQHLRLVHERQREVEAPAHAAGVGADPAVGRAGETDALEQHVATLVGLGLGDAVQHGLQAQSSRPVINGSMAASCSATPMERRTSPPGRHVETGHPRPARGGLSSVTSIRTIVDLPAPLGPRKPKISPSLDHEVDAVDRDEVTEAADQALRLDRRVVMRLRRLRWPATPARGWTACRRGARRGGASASTTAFCTAGVEPIVPDSPMPLAPSGLTAVGVSIATSSKPGSSAAEMKA